MQNSILKNELRILQINLKNALNRKTFFTKVIKQNFVRLMTFLTSEEINLLSKIGFIAVALRDKIRALAIFSLLKQLRPNNALPVIGMALTWIGVKEPIYAIHLLEKTVLQDENEQFIVSIYLGLALLLDKKHKESRRILNFVLKKMNEKFQMNEYENKKENLIVSGSVIEAYEMGKELLNEINKHNLV